MKKSQIKKIKAREILDSRGYPTVEVDLETNFGVFYASVPSGTSKSIYEAKELRDGGPRYLGMGVSKAVQNVNKIIAPKLIGQDPSKQEKLDLLMRKLDGTKDKGSLGANAMLAVSMALCRSAAFARSMPLWQWISQLAETSPSMPVPCLLYLEGGLHGRGDLDVQEFMAITEADSFAERLRIGTELYHNLRELINEKFGKRTTNVGLEGGFTPPLQETSDALNLLIEAALKTSNKKVKLILDVAASTFYRDGKYYFEGEIFDRKALFDFYSDICAHYPIQGLEDPFAQTDWQGFQELNERLGKKIDIIGDDLLATNVYRMEMAEDKNACQGLILKPNQIGTVTETIETAKHALTNQWQVFVKHRAGETSDTFISDLAVGLGTGWIMAGAPQRVERVAKYNRLLRIAEELKLLKP